MAGGDRGKDFENMMRNLLRETCSDVRRVFDARSFREVAKFAPAVHCDYEAVVTGGVNNYMKNPEAPLVKWEPTKDLHLYFEMKASKDPRKFPFKSLIRGTIRKGKTGDQDSDWTKWGQMGFCQKVSRFAASEQYWYMVGNRYTPGAYYALLLDWEDVAYWLRWLESERREDGSWHPRASPKASVPWEHMKKRAMEAGGLDRLLFQAEGGKGEMRFVNEENVDKMKRVLGIDGWEVRRWE